MAPVLDGMHLLWKLQSIFDDFFYLGGLVVSVDCSVCEISLHILVVLLIPPYDLGTKVNSIHNMQLSWIILLWFLYEAINDEIVFMKLLMQKSARSPDKLLLLDHYPFVKIFHDFSRQHISSSWSIALMTPMGFVLLPLASKSHKENPFSVEQKKITFPSSFSFFHNSDPNPPHSVLFILGGGKALCPHLSRRVGKTEREKHSSTTGWHGAGKISNTQNEKKMQGKFSFPTFAYALFFLLLVAMQCWLAHILLVNKIIMFLRRDRRPNG